MLVLFNGLQAGNDSGTGRYTQRLAEALTAMEGGVDVAVVWPEGVARSATNNAASYIESSATGALRRVMFDQIGIKQTRRRLGADVVHYPASVGALTRIPNTVLTVHDLSFLREPSWFPAGRSFYYRRAVLRSARLATRIVADSQATADDLVSMAGIAASRIDVVHLGVDEAYRPASEDAQAAARRDYGLPDRFFLYCGTLEPRKNIPRLVEAWSSIADRCDWDLVIAGRRGWQVKPIEEAVANSPYAARIHPAGFIEEEELSAVLSAAGAFVWPSLWEGFGLPPLEAMACGTPVLTSSTSSLPEVVGDAALLVDPYDTAAIAEGMLRLAEDETLRADLRAKGLARAAGFTWRKTAEETVECYRQVLRA